MDEKTIPLLTTSRLFLRAFNNNDLDALHQIVQEPGIFRYFPRQDPWPIEKTERYIQYHHKHWHERGYGHWAVVARSSGQLLGWAGLEFLPDTNETEVAYLLSRLYWGKGLATEAAKVAVDFGLNQIGIQEIIGLAHHENIGSQRVLEKCGLVFTHRANYFGMDLSRFAIRKS